MAKFGDTALGERERIKLSGVDQRQWMLMPERKVTRESAPPKTAQPRSDSSWGDKPVCISANEVFHQCEAGQDSRRFGDDKLVRAGRAQRRRLIRQPLSPSGQEIMGLNQEEGGRGPKPRQQPTDRERTRFGREKRLIESESNLGTEQEVTSQLRNKSTREGATWGEGLGSPPET